MIIGQSIYQLVVTFVIYFAGASLFNYDRIDERPRDRQDDQQIQLNTVVFNTFVWMQIFNEFNNRRLDNKLNIFEGIQRNWFFIGINCIMVGGQVMIIFVGDLAFDIVKLNSDQWAISILCAMPCLLWAIVIRCIPDKYAAMVFHWVGIVYFAIYNPLYKFVLQPFGHVIRSIWRPISRTSSRAKNTILRKKSSNSSEKSPAVDEEAGNEKLGEELSKNPSTPASNVPPITLTTPA